MNVQEHFARQAADYQNLMVRLIPQYLEQHRVIADLLPRGSQRPLRLLDLGCANGVLSEVALQKLPDLEVTGVDITREMLHAFTHKISRYTSSFRVIEGDYREVDLGGPYDIVLAGLTLHHLAPDTRREFYGTLLDVMKPGGMLVARDVIIDEDDQVCDDQYRLWKAFMQGNDEDPEFWYEKHLQKDSPITLTDLLSWMRDAGFVRIGCHWRCYNFAITSGHKPGA